MKIEVTQKHIDCGDIGSDLSCPIGLAIKEQIDGADNPSVGIREIVVPIVGRGILQMKPTDIIVKFIEQFDNGEQVEPQTFFLSSVGAME